MARWAWNMGEMIGTSQGQRSATPLSPEKEIHNIN